jgi:hypothetical protein
MIWEGRRGEPSSPVMPLDLNVRPIVDEKYIIPKTIDFIKPEAAAKKPFFVYVVYSEMHPRPSPIRDSPANPPSGAACTPTFSAKWTFASARSLMRSKRRVSTTARW